MHVFPQKNLDSFTAAFFISTASNGEKLKLALCLGNDQFMVQRKTRNGSPGSNEILAMAELHCKNHVFHSNYDELLRVVNICTLFWVFGVINTPHKAEQNTNTLQSVNKKKTTPEKAILVFGKPNPTCHSLQLTGKPKEQTAIVPCQFAANAQ